MAQNKKMMKLSSTFKTPRLLSCFLFVFKGAVYVYFGDRQPWFSILWIRMKGNAFEYFPLFRSAIDSTCSNDQRSVVWSFSGKCKHFIEKNADAQNCLLVCNLRYFWLSPILIFNFQSVPLKGTCHFVWIIFLSIFILLILWRKTSE